MNKLSIVHKVTGELEYVSAVSSDDISYALQSSDALLSTRRNRNKVACTLKALHLPYTVVEPTLIEFDIEGAITGAGVVTREGKWVQELHYFSFSVREFIVVYCVNGKLRKANVQGKDSCNINYDLFMEEE